MVPNNSGKIGTAGQVIEKYAGATANLKLTFHLDHSAGADHSRVIEVAAERLLQRDGAGQRPIGCIAHNTVVAVALHLAAIRGLPPGTVCRNGRLADADN